ncbi:MAG: alpha/beta fold hydrolase [Thermoanaerobaculia bacterium]
MIERVVELPPYRFWERRDGAGTPVVLIHGLGGSADWWRRNFEGLAEDHLVSAVDLVGFGRNRFFWRRSSLPLSFVEIASLLIRWIETSFEEPVHLAGHSMGGHIAIHVAAQRPELVRSLTLVSATGIPFELKPGRHLEHLVVPRRALSFLTTLARDVLRSGPTSLALAFARLLRDDARPLMRELRMPVLLVWGEHDPMVPVAYAKQIVAEIPQSRLAVIPTSGHIPMWENPEEFNRELRIFLSDVERGTIDGASAGRFSWGLSGWVGGIAHREAGRRRDIVLVHGLGMSSAYLTHFARALFERGWNPIAPDLPGFGESLNGSPASPDEHARMLARWAESLKIREAVWVGHSIGCNAVAHLAATRPDLCREAIHIGPLWMQYRVSLVRMGVMLIIDSMREPLRLYAYVIPAYWRVGVLRWWQTVRLYFPDFTAEPPGAKMIAGRRDPLPDRSRVTVEEVGGAHACLFSHPEECAAAVGKFEV